MCNGDDLILNPLFNFEPMKGLEYWGDVKMFESASNVFSIAPNCATHGRTYKLCCTQFNLRVRGHFSPLCVRSGNIVETFPTLAILNCKLHNVNLDIFLYS